MAGGGFGIKKKFFNMVLDHPVKVYLGSGAFLYALRWYQTQKAYNYHFGKFEYERSKYGTTLAKQA